MLTVRARTLRLNSKSSVRIFQEFQIPQNILPCRATVRVSEIIRRAKLHTGQEGLAQAHLT